MRFTGTSFGNGNAFSPKYIGRDALQNKTGITFDIVLLSLESLKHLSRVSKELASVIVPDHTIILIDVSGGLIPLQDKVRSRFPNNRVCGILCDINLVWGTPERDTVEQIGTGSNVLVEPLDQTNNYRVRDVVTYLQTAGLDAARAKSSDAFTKVQLIKAIPVVAFEPLSILFELTDVDRLKESVIARPIIEGLVSEMSAIAARLGHAMPSAQHFLQTSKLRTAPQTFKFPKASLLFFHFYHRHSIAADLLFLFPILMADELRAGKTPYLEMVFAMMSQVLAINENRSKPILFSRAGQYSLQANGDSGDANGKHLNGNAADINGKDAREKDELNHQMSLLSLKQDEVSARESAVVMRERTIASKMQDLASREHALQVKYQELAARKQEVASREASVMTMKHRVSPDGVHRSPSRSTSPPKSGDAASTGSSGSSSGASEELLRRRESELQARERALRAREQQFMTRVKAVPSTTPLPQYNGGFKPPPGSNPSIPPQHPARNLPHSGPSGPSPGGIPAPIPPLAPERQARAEPPQAPAIPPEDIDMMSMTARRTRHRSFVKSPSTVMNSANLMGRSHHRMSSPALSMMAQKQSYSQQFELSDLENTMLDRYGGTTHQPVYSRMPSTPSMRGISSRANSISSQSAIFHRPSMQGPLNGHNRSPPELQTPLINGDGPRGSVFTMPNGSGSSEGSGNSA